MFVRYSVVHVNSTSATRVPPTTLLSVTIMDEDTRGASLDLCLLFAHDHVEFVSDQRYRGRGSELECSRKDYMEEVVHFSMLNLGVSSVSEGASCISARNGVMRMVEVCVPFMNSRVITEERRW